MAARSGCATSASSATLRPRSRVSAPSLRATTLMDGYLAITSIALVQIAERRRAGRPADHRDLALAADALGRPARDVAADLLLVHGDVQRLVRRRGPARDGDDRDLGLGRRVVGGIDADRIDGRDQHAFDAPGEQVLNAVDLAQLVLVGRDVGDLPAELLSPRADALEHGDVERVVVLR